MEAVDIESRNDRKRENPRSYFSGRKWISWLIPIFVLANVAVFVVVMFINNCPKHPHPLGKCVARFLGRLSFQPLRENPLFGPSSSTLKKLGALDWNKVVHGHQGWRLLSSIWLHAGIIHLLVNMIFLIFVGLRSGTTIWLPRPLHRERVRIGIIYILSGFGGSVLSLLFIRQYISVGASGSLFGLLGAMLSELIQNWTIYSNKASALVTLVVVILINLAVGILPHVDNFAHIGGFITGFLLGFILLMRPQFGWREHRNPPTNQVETKYRAYQRLLWLIALILLIPGFVVGLTMLFRGENANNRCHWCHYLSCVPTSRWSCDET